MTDQDLISLIEEVLEERKKKRKKSKKKKEDRCTRIAKRKYDVWPSAYASGAVVKCRQGKIWKNLKEEDLAELSEEELLEILSEEEDETLEEKKRKLTKKPSSETSLRDWFKRKGEPGKKGGWVDCNSPKRKDGKITGYKSCGRSGKDDKRSKYPACRPTPSACKSKGRGKSWGKKSAKGMKESMDNLQQLIENEILVLLNEAKVEEVQELIRLSNQENHKAFFDGGDVKPEKKEEYDLEVEKYHSQLSNIPKQYLSWVQKMSNGDPEPLDEIISMLKVYLQNKGKFQGTKLKNLTPGKIRDKLEELGGGSYQKSSGEIPPGNDEIYNSNNWIGVYPKSERGSIDACKNLSNGVQWCTAATQSQNYFNEYSGKYNIYLYYFFKKGGNTRKDPDDAIAIGWVKEKGQAKIIHGANATVNAKNKDLSENDLQNIFGQEWKAIKQKMTKDLESEERKDTAFNEILNSLTPETLDAQLQGKDPEEQVSALYNLLNQISFASKPEKANFVIEKLYKIFQENRSISPKMNLNLSRTHITSFPPGLKVAGDLNLRYTRITNLPDNMEVGGSLILEDTPINSLPNGLKVGKDLEAQRTSITSLPDDLKVGRDLILNYTPITSLPDNLKVIGHLELDNTKITKLPNNLEVGESLHLDETPITELTLNAKIGGDLSLYGAKITSLSGNLEVGGDLNLGRSKITSISGKLKVGRDLEVDNTPLQKLPNNLWVGRDLFLYEATIDNLPSGLEVGGDIFVGGTYISELPKDLKVGGQIKGLEYTRKKEKESMDNLQEQILSEVMQLLESTNISEGMQYHLDNQIPITETIYRPFSDAFIRLIKEARTLHSLGLYEALTEDEEELLESDLGEFGFYEGQRVPLDRPMLEEEDLDEAKYKGKDVKLGKPTKGDVKKYKVYVRNKKGNVIKVNYGDQGMKGNWNDPKARRSFAARHKCAEKKDRTKPGYWACRAHKHFGKNVSGAYW